MIRRTIGLDLGTHQTKICVEERDGVELSYIFFQFLDQHNQPQYTLPSIVQINGDNTLNYGYITVGDEEMGEPMPELKLRPCPLPPHEYPKPQKPTIPERPNPENAKSLFEAAFKRTELLQWKKKYGTAEKEYQELVACWEKSAKEDKERYDEDLKTWITDKERITKEYETKMAEWMSRHAQGTKAVIRYFKQATFTDSIVWKHSIKPEFFTIWYLAFILFDLEDKYGNSFSVQMGCPSGTANQKILHEKAVSLLLSAFALVEHVYKNDKKAFLRANIDELVDKTIIISYSYKQKLEYNIKVFPEAYACLRTLSTRGKLSPGMSLIVDIGGGTTDISFFSIEKYGDAAPQIYHYTSIPKGLNYLTRAEEKIEDRRADSNIVSQKEIDANRVNEFYIQIKGECDSLLSRLHVLFRQETKLRESRLDDALRERPIVYVGGGSVFPQLRATYGGFSDQKQISVNDWNTLYIKNLHNVEKLSHLLSTAYGLSIGAKNDDITLKDLSQLFDGIKGVEEDEDDKFNRIAVQQRRSYKQDYIYKEYGTLHDQKKTRVMPPTVIHDVQQTNKEFRSEAQERDCLHKQLVEQKWAIIHVNGYNNLQNLNRGGFTKNSASFNCLFAGIRKFGIKTKIKEYHVIYIFYHNYAYWIVDAQKKSNDNIYRQTYDDFNNWINCFI